MKILVAFSGGKDSLACLLWAVKNPQYKNIPIEAVFCDTGWEHELTYSHIKEVTDKLQIKLVTLKSKKYDGFVDLAVKKKRFPSIKAKFCTEELKVKPMIDYVLDEVNDNVIIIQGIRSDESPARSKMNKQCTYFKYYFEPYGINKKGKPKKHSYRKRDVIKFREKYNDDVLRPCIDWTAMEIMNYIILNEFKPNPLYYMNMKRVGCYPCIMCNHKELHSIIKQSPEHIKKLKEAEKDVAKTFFPPNIIPTRFQTKIDPKSGKSIASVEDVVKYLEMRSGDSQEGLFPEPDQEGHKCMSVYNICE